MNTSKIVIAATVLAGAVGIGICLREQGAGTRAEAALRELNRQNQSLAAQMAALVGGPAGTAASDPTGTPVRSSAGAKGLGAAAAGGAAAAKRGSAAKDPGVGPRPVVNRELSSNPAIRAGLGGWITACQNVTQGPLFKALGLTPDQVDTLNALELQFDINMGDNVLTFRPEGSTLQDVNQSIHALLGDAGYQQYGAYSSTQFVRAVAGGLAGNLIDSEAPLTSDQADQLTQILAQNSTAPKGEPPFPGQVNWEPALAQAQAILSPQQLAVLSQLATVISSQPGLWGGLNPIAPGSTGQSSGPPASFFAAEGAPKK